MAIAITKRPAVAATDRRGELARAQREESRRRLLDAATRLFAERGYIAPAIDEIAQEAGVSRQTFYRHFDGKLAIGLALLERESERTRPLWERIDDHRARDDAAVAAWLTGMVSASESPRLSRALTEMGVIEPSFFDRARLIVGQVVATLGERIHAFRPADAAEDGRRHGEAWLLIYHLLEQFSLLARGIEVVERGLLVRIMAAQFAEFARRHDPAK